MDSARSLDRDLAAYTLERCLDSFMSFIVATTDPTRSIAEVLAGVVATAHDRIAIVGGPRSGKTTLSNTIRDRPVYHGDDYAHLGWSEASEYLAVVVNEAPGPLVVEGVSVPRALRKGMRVDAVVVLEGSHVELTPGQASMAKGVWTVFAEWRAANPEIPVFVVGPDGVVRG